MIIIFNQINNHLLSLINDYHLFYELKKYKICLKNFDLFTFLHSYLSQSHNNNLNFIKASDLLDFFNILSFCYKNLYIFFEYLLINHFNFKYLD